MNAKNEEAEAEKALVDEQRALDAAAAAAERGPRGLGEALLRLAARRHQREPERFPAPTDEDRVFMRALMDSFGEAESAGSVCVTANDAAGALLAIHEGHEAAAEEAVGSESLPFFDGRSIQGDDAGQLAGDGLGPLGESPLALVGPQVESGLKSLEAMGLACSMPALVAAADAREARREASCAAAEGGAGGRLPPIAPLVIDEPAKKRSSKGFDYASANARIYTARNAMEELELARRLYALAKSRPLKLSAAAEAAVAGFEHGGVGPQGEKRWGLDADQLAALRLAAERRFAVITGGPGTGKTSIVAKVLEVLLADAAEKQKKDAPDAAAASRLRIALAAPTGKATSRMRQSIENSLREADLTRLSALVEQDARLPPEERALREHTIHKWLVMPTASGERPSAANPIPADVLVLDEASMIDVHLAARLFRAVSPETRVIVLGDKHQLAAVGPGAVFADLSASDGALKASVATLQTSWRFPKGCIVERLAAAVNDQGDKAADKSKAVTAVRQILSEPQTGERYRVSWSSEPCSEDGSGLSEAAKSWIDLMSQRYAKALMPYLEAVDRNLPAEETRRRLDALWGALSSFRALAANRRGPQSVAAVNSRFMANLAEALEAAGRRDAEDPDLLAGRAVIVRTNDDMLGVFNGDVGIVIPERAEGGMRRTVWFGDRRSAIPLALLPAHETAFAMTIHQSQGSEFDDVAVFLPASEHSGLATRELLYTAITRTKATASIFGSEAALVRAVITATERASGLKDRLAETAKATASARRAEKALA